MSSARAAAAVVVLAAVSCDRPAPRSVPDAAPATKQVAPVSRDEQVLNDFLDCRWFVRRAERAARGERDSAATPGQLGEQLLARSGRRTTRAAGEGGGASLTRGPFRALGTVVDEIEEEAGMGVARGTARTRPGTFDAVARFWRARGVPLAPDTAPAPAGFPSLREAGVRVLVARDTLVLLRVVDARVQGGESYEDVVGPGVETRCEVGG